MSNGQLHVHIDGLTGVSDMLQLADVTIKEDWNLVWKGFIRQTPIPKSTQNVMDREYTLEGSTQDAFDASGKNAYSEPWDGYGNEPKYAAMKARKTGSLSVLVWVGSKNPLRAAFLKGHKDHVESVRNATMKWGVKGVKGEIAKRLAQGGFWQPWDKTRNTPARPAIRATEATAINVCKGMQRVLLARLGSDAYRAARASAPRQ